MSAQEKAAQPLTHATLRSLDDDVAVVIDLQEQIEELQSQLVAAKGRIADRGVGQYETTTGIKVTVSEPPRSFDVEKAWGLLTDEQRAVCQAPDSRKIRQQLPPVLAEQCMAAGNGKPRVTVR